MSGINIEACNVVERDNLSLPLLPFVYPRPLSFVDVRLASLVARFLGFGSSIPCAGVIERDSLLARKQPQISISNEIEREDSSLSYYDLHYTRIYYMRQLNRCYIPSTKLDQLIDNIVRLELIQYNNPRSFIIFQSVRFWNQMTIFVKIHVQTK